MKAQIARTAEKAFEIFLWNSRFIVILAVVASMISSVILFLLATFDVFELIGKVFKYVTLSGSERTVAAYEEFHGDVVGHIIGAVDDYLLATVLFIFALGLYELFISKIDEAEAEAATSSRILLIHSLDDLKDRLAKVILMMRLPSWSVIIAVLSVVLAGAVHSAEKPAGPEDLHHARPPAVKGNPAVDPTAPPRTAEPGRLLLSCIRRGEPRPAEMYASAKDFDEGKQSFYLRRWNQAGAEMIYPLHGYFLDGGAVGIFMLHDGKGTRQQETIRIDQTVNMGLLFIRTTSDGLRAILSVYAENENTPAEEKDFKEFSCLWGEGIRRLSFDKAHVRSTPNTGARPPSHWYRESDTKLLACTAIGPTGEYQIELLGSTMWPGHLAFLLVRALEGEPVGYNVHVLEGPGRLLIHAHSYPHRTRAQMMDTMEETETVIGGLLLRKVKNGYTGWIGLVAAAADPYNTSFSRDATLGDYAALGHAVVPPLPVTCR